MGLKDSVVRCAANSSSAWRKGAKVRREVDLSLDVHRVSAWWRTVVVEVQVSHGYLNVSLCM